MADQANKHLSETAIIVAAVTKQFKALDAQTTKNLATQKVLLEQQKQLNAALKATSGAKEYASIQKQIEGNIKAVSLAEKEAIEVQKKAQQLERERIKTASAHAREKARVAKATSKLNSLYKQESARLTELRNKAKDMAMNLIRLTDKFGKNSVEVRRATAAFREAQAGVNRLDGQLRRVDSSLGQNQRNVGNYSSALGGLKNILGAAGFVGGFRLFFSTLKDGIVLSREYEKSNAVLASVLGKQLSETVKLQSESKRLGETTAFTASEVTELQTELARLGKTEAEIVASTEGIIAATIALGSETGETAALVGSTLNAFQLAASKSGKVADVLTLATQKSALSFQKLNTALPIVAGSAAAAGVSLETVVAQLGQAADRGIDASTSASALRNIYIELEKSGLSLEDALGQINNSSNKVATAFDLFGKKGISTALALAGTIDKTDRLKKSLENAGGTAARVAATQLDTLDGSLKLLNSAWEGLVLSVFSAEGSIGSFARGVVDATTSLITFINTLSKQERVLTDIESAIGKTLESYTDEKALLDDSNTARELLIENLGIEGLSYSEAKIEADKYLKTLQFINSELGKDLAKNVEINLLKNEIALLEKSGGAYDVLYDKKLKLKELEDEFKFSKIELIKATNEELTQYLELEKSLLDISDAKQKFVDDVKEEIAAREAAVVIAEEEAAVLKDLIAEKQKEIKAAKEVVASSEPELAIRNRKVKALEDELAALRALGLEEVKEVKDIDQAEFKKNEIALAKAHQKELDKLEADELAEFFKNEDIKTKKLEEEEAKRRGFINQGRDIAIDAAGTILANSITTNAQKVDDEIAKNREELNTKLADENLNEDQRAVLKAEADKREGELKKKRVKAERKDAIFQVGINAIVAASKTLATLGVPLGLIPAGIALATGVAQAAVIAAKPLPEFDKGVLSAPSGGFWAGEKRPEFMINKGQLSFIDKPTVFGNEAAGATILGGAETASMLDNLSRNEAINNISGYNEVMSAQMLDLAMLKLETRNQTRAIVGAINGNQQSGLDKMREKNYNNGINKHRE